ncbi:uncharacterized protein UDID_18126 [Ustilago sp. UG-2017a]|nr:uncharacterized protein UDID_18126 [Ustilago sp. UG-2017a]
MASAILLFLLLFLSLGGWSSSLYSPHTFFVTISDGDAPLAPTSFDALRSAAHLRPNTDFVADVFDPDIKPARFGSMQDCADNWDRLLRRYPSGIFRRQLLGMIWHGCLLGYDGPLRNANRSACNLLVPAEGHTHIRRELDACLCEGRLTIIPPSTALVESPIGVVLKPRSTKLRTIHHLSHPRKPNGTTLPSVNAGISPSFVRIQYENLDALLSFVSENPGCLLWKGDLEDTFCHVVTATPDAHLLGFSYDGVHYCENTLTFGGSSSPWLFNLVTEFLHWVVAACLPPDWPVGHYLDDTFGAVPASDTTNALWPVHVLALTAAALGLRLSPKKTFGNTTKLEILGIEIDSVTQTVSITNERQARILSQCRSLLQRRSADLLDMQRIASLLQFISQVFPCSKAFLRRLYDATRCAASVRCRISRETRAELTWWCRVLESWSGTTVLLPSPLLVAHIWTDACPCGFGGYLGPASNLQAIFATETPCRHRTKNIRFLEALTVLEALRRFSPLWGTPRLVVVHVDNANVEHGLWSGRSHDPLTQRLIREIYSLCFTRNITLQPVRVSTSDNMLADLLSRRRFRHIKSSFPQAYSQLPFHSAHAPTTATHHQASPPASPSLRLLPPCSGTGSPPALASERVAALPPFTLSACASSALAPPASRQAAPSSWNGSPTSPLPAAPSTPPNTNGVPCGPTMWTSASMSPALAAAALNVPSVDISACMEFIAQAPSFRSPSPSFAASSRPSLGLPTFTHMTISSSKPPSPASSVPASSSGAPTPTRLLASPFPQSSGNGTTPSSPSWPRRPTLSSMASRSSPRKSVASSARLLGSGNSPRASPLPTHSSAWVHPALPPSRGRPSSAPSSAPSRLSASQRTHMPATPFAAAPPHGLRRTAFRTPSSSCSAAGIRTATGVTSTSPLPNGMHWPPQPCSPSATGRLSQIAWCGATWAPADPPVFWVPPIPSRDHHHLRLWLDRRVGGLGATELATSGPETRISLTSPVSADTEHEFFGRELTVEGNETKQGSRPEQESRPG